MSRLLLDSHVFLWYIQAPSSLSLAAVGAIRSADEILISAATIWELTIKRVSGKLKVSGPLIEKAEEYGFTMLDITPEHGEAIE